MSRVPFEIFLALRYLRPKRTFVSVITLISVIGVLLGVAVLIIVISVMTGFDRQLRDKILGFNAHLRIMRHETTLGDYDALRQRIASHPDVKAVAPYVLGQVLVKTQPQTGSPAVRAPFLRGIDPPLETNITSLTTNIVIGKFDLEDRGILVGVELAHNLKIYPGDRLSIYSPQMLERMEKSRGKDNEEAVPPKEFQVRGIFDVGYFEYNANVIVASLSDAQELYDIDNSVHGLMAMLYDAFKVDQVRNELQHILGRDYEINTWTEENSYILNALLVEKNVMFYLLFFIMIVAAFGIMNSLITFVVQKTREIGVLKALGATRGQVIWIFLSQSLLVGVVGVLAGLGLGMLALEYRNSFLHFMNRMTGIELFPASIYSFTELPALIVPRDIITICGSALVICLLAGLIPAWIAGRLKPVEALRHE
ncbi:MAG TPA: ABC transporter permease [Verrucomicrobiae bacterium]|nr:ABC transporter permease [Verrucomicrobiae bacterium]